MSYFVLRMISEAVLYAAIISPFIKIELKALLIASIPYLVYLVSQIIMTKGMFDNYRYSMITKIKFVVWAIMIPITCTLQATFLDIGSIKYLLILGVIAFVMDVFILRMYRLGKGATFKERMLDTGYVLAGVTSSVGIGALTYLLIRFSGIFFNFLGIIFGGIWLLVSWILIYVKKAYDWFLALAGFSYSDSEAEPIIQEVDEEAIINYVEKNPIVNDASGSWEKVDGFIVKLIAFILFILVIVAIIWVVVKASRGLIRVKNNQVIENGTRDYKDLQKGKIARKELFTKKSYKEQIRRIYLDYLRHIQGKGFFIKQRDTSLDILNFAEQNEVSELDLKLREIYIRTRYQTEDKVSEDEVKEAKALYKAILASDKK